MKTLIALFLFFVALPLASRAQAAESDYFVSYTITQATRDTATSPWVQNYSEPFGARVGFGVGVVFSDHSIADPSQPNCYDVSLSPLSNDGMKSLRNEIDVTAYRGDAWCGDPDPSKDQTVGTFKSTVLQGQSTVLTLPFLSGKQVKLTINQTWNILRR